MVGVTFCRGTVNTRISVGGAYLIFRHIEISVKRVDYRYVSVILRVCKKISTVTNSVENKIPFKIVCTKLERRQLDLL